MCNGSIHSFITKRHSHIAKWITIGQIAHGAAGGYSLPYYNDRSMQCTAKLGSGWCREDGMNGRNCQSPYIFCDWLRAESRICTDRLKTVSRFPTLRVEALELAPQRLSARLLSRRHMQNPHLSAISFTGSTIF